MTKTVTQIDCPKEWESNNDWDSHRPMLHLCIKNKGGDVVEMGSGVGSTLLLDNECYVSGRKFLSIEETPEKGCSPLYGHSIIRDGYLGIENRWTEIFDTFDIGVLFIDVAPAELRKELIEHWKDKSETIVVHDTEIGAEYVYGMSKVLSAFKYRLDYQPIGKPHTTVVSNFIDVTQWI